MLGPACHRGVATAEIEAPGARTRHPGAPALVAHWRETAERIARQSREAREAQIGWQQHDALVQQAQAQQAFALQAQYQQQLGQQLGQCAAQQNMPQGAFEGLCNCVPSRAQMWGAQHGLVQRLNDGSD